MKAYFLLAALAAAAIAPALAQEAAKPEAAKASSLPPPATTVYRQVLPDGRIVYSDEPVKGGKVDHTIKVEPPIKGNLWTTEAGPKPVAPARNEATPIKKVTTPPVRKKSLEQADADVARAQKQLDEARKKQELGVEPGEGERTGTASGGSRLNDTYHVRQKWLAREVEQAQENLNKALKEREAAGSAR